MKKRTTLLMMTLGIAAMLGGCGGQKGAVKDYSKYVELGDYKGLTLDRVITTVTDEDIQDEIDSELSYSAEYNEVTDRAAKEGDVVVVSYVGTIDGTEFDGGSETDVEIELGSETYIDGFEEGIVGMKVGEEKSFDVTFPEDYDGELDGKTATFTVTLSTIYDVTMPEYNDEFVASISDYSTVEEYEASLREELQQEYDEDAQSMANEDALATVIENSTFNGYPDELYESCKTSMDEDNALLLQEFGLSDISELYGEDYNEEEYIEELVNERMVVYSIASAEKLDVTDEEYKAALEEDLMYTDYATAEEYEKSLSDIDSYKYNILREKVMTFLGENNTFNDVEDNDYYEDLSEDVFVEDVIDDDVDVEGDYAGSQLEEESGEDAGTEETSEESSEE